MQKLSERKYFVSKELVFRKEADGALIFNPDTGNVYALNKTGVFLWKKILQGQTLSQLEKKLKQTYPDVNNKKIRRDLQTFLKQLLKNKLISVK